MMASSNIVPNPDVLKDQCVKTLKIDSAVEGTMGKTYIKRQTLLKFVNNILESSRSISVVSSYQPKKK